ncbi:hypothetical protein R5W24_001579 [Gemmata sp. JC717]|uniref:Carboxypeptidase regulatory-like domain-containing protein n=1 Tax=Gemmata algarum TaxID=2975278 RepID=A0ABU5EUC8_9BACT|nr:hypothetical protein [Gemmata algarum]MDY3552496.1 hypothetical protein [Gemmata algarum]MDY3558921.1 hypothetical protein [Gemmata algarum]
MRVLRFAGAVTAFAAAVALVGCSDGPDLADVSGTVSYDGKPLDDGAITFVPADGKGGTAGGVIKDGKYTAARVPTGHTKVVISGSKVVGKKKVYPTPNSPEMPVTAELLPPKYSDPAKTELTHEVKSGTNEKNWELGK